MGRALQALDGLAHVTPPLQSTEAMPRSADVAYREHSNGPEMRVDLQAFRVPGLRHFRCGSEWPIQEKPHPPEMGGGVQLAPRALPSSNTEPYEGAWAVGPQQDTDREFRPRAARRAEAGGT